MMLRSAAMRIYTRRGDDGSTGLFGGPRVGKDDARVRAYGEVDELNSALGVARCELGDGRLADLDAFAARLQGELFDLGAELATPDPANAPRSVPRASADGVLRLEKEIDRLEAELTPLTTFILPGGSRAGAALHVCRAICRRAEREVVALSRSAPVSREALSYLNRLGDLLFVMARAAGHRTGTPEVAWKPGT